MDLCGCPVRGAECTSLLLLLSPGPWCLGDLYFGVSLGRADLEKVNVSQSSLQGKRFIPLTVLALSSHTGDRLCMATHPSELARGSSNTVLVVQYALS